MRRAASTWYFYGMACWQKAVRILGCRRPAARGPITETLFTRRCEAAARFFWASAFFLTSPFRPFAERQLWGIRALREAEKAARPAKPMVNRVIARLPAATYFDRITRPALYVHGYDGTPESLAAIRGLKFVREMTAAIAGKIEAAEAAVRAEAEASKTAASAEAEKVTASFIRVHTTHKTGPLCFSP